MDSAELYIEGIKIDLFKDESIELTQSLKNIQKLESVFSDFTRDFNVPASKNNQNIFKRFEKPDILNGFDNRVRKNAQIRINGSVWKRGYVSIEDVKMINGAAISYKISFLGGLASFKKRLKDAKLSTLFSLNQENFKLDADLIQQLLSKSREDDNDLYGTKLLYSLISHQDGLYYDSGTITANTPNLAYNNSTTYNGVEAWSLKPSIRLNDIILAIESDYNMSFSNDFFKNTSQLDFYNLYMWLSNTSEYITEDDTDRYKTFIYRVTDWTVTNKGSNVTGNEDDYYSINNEQFYLKYIPPFKILQDSDLTVTPADNNLEYQIALFDRELGEYIEGGVTDWLTGVSEVRFDGPIIGNKWVEMHCKMEGSQTLTIELENAYSGTNNNFTFEGEVSSNLNLPFLITEHMPDLKITEFLQGLFRAFNLVAFEEADGTIKVLPYVDYIASGTDYDITEFVDDSKYTISGEFKYNEIQLSFEETEDKYSVQHKNQNGRLFGEYKFKYTDINTQANVYPVKVPLSVMKYKRLEDDNTSTDTNIQIGQANDLSGDSVDIKALVYYPIISSGSICLKKAATDVEELTVFNIPSNTLELFHYDDQDAITFENEISSFDGTLGHTDTLFNKYHNEYLSPLFNRRFRVFNVDAYLPKRILLKFTLADRFIFKGVAYRINSIKTDITTGKSKISLRSDSTLAERVITRLTIGNAPVITILGSNPVSVEAGASYVDAGATATDVEDGTLTGSIVIVTPDIDTGATGTQRVTYTVTDSDGNLVAESRVVNISDTVAPTDLGPWAYGGAKTANTVDCDWHWLDVGGFLNLFFEYKETSSGTWLPAGYEYPTVNETTGTKQFKGLTTATSYDFRCTATDRGGNSTTSVTVTQTTL